MASKPKIAFFDFAGCEGDQLQVANLEEQLIELLQHVEVVNFREVMTERGDDYDIAFIEGSITTNADVERIKGIREKAKLVVALGACATIGGVNCMKNFMDEEVYRSHVYGPMFRAYDTIDARPVRAVVKVDAEIHGCPIDRDEFLSVTKQLLLGKAPWIPDYPVCMDCKAAGNICRYELGRPCLGIVTRAGCKAACVTEGATCWGCRGLAPKANLDAAKYVMLDRGGFSRRQVQDLMRLYNGYTSAPL